jgi:hypothetical protein
MQSEDLRHESKQADVINNIAVRVFANTVGNKIAFTHDWAVNGGQEQDPPIDLPNKSGSWNIDLQLHDFTGLGLEFDSSNPDDVMWVHKGTGCPGGKGSGGQMNFKSVGRSGPNPNDPLDLLKVNDDNQGAACDLHFMLHFKAGQKKYQYDPIIRNGGTN